MPEASYHRYDADAKYELRIGENENWNQRLFYGIELELSTRSRRDADEISAFLKHDMPYAHVGEDSSVSGFGMEIRFDPGTFSFWDGEREVVESVFGYLRNRPYTRSGVHADAGMHVHMDKDAFSRLHMYKFLSFVYGNEEFSYLISGRSKSTLNRWSVLNTREPLVYKAMQKGGQDCYEALNVGHSETIEVRLFQGTLHDKEFYKNLEFLDALYNYTLEESIRRVSVDGLYDFTSGFDRKYSNFWSWLNANAS